MSGKSPLELLTPDPEIRTPFITPIIGPFVGVFFGLGGSIFANWGMRRPVLTAGIQRHIIFGVAGGIIAYWIDQKRNAYLAERDAVLRHYVMLHEDEFPAPERKKIGDLFLPWEPVR